MKIYTPEKYFFKLKFHRESAACDRNFGSPGHFLIHFLIGTEETLRRWLVGQWSFRQAPHARWWQAGVYQHTGHVTPGQNAPLWSRSAFNFRESCCLFLTAQRHLHAEPAFALFEVNILSNWESKRRDNDLRKSDFGQSCQPHALKQTYHDKTSAYYYNQHSHNRFSWGTTTRRFEFRQKIGTNMMPGKITLNENILT